MKASCHSRFVLLLVLSGLLFSACAKLDSGVSEAEAEVVEFRSLVRKKEFSLIHEQSSQAFKDRATLSDLEAFLLPFANTITEAPRRLVNWKVGVDRTHGYIVTLTYQATGETSLPNEEFIYVSEGEKYRLLNYRIW
jgi:hypothetical protein